jgi:hypothetical protein
MASFSSKDDMILFPRLLGPALLAKVKLKNAKENYANLLHYFIFSVFGASFLTALNSSLLLC